MDEKAKINRLQELLESAREMSDLRAKRLIAIKSTAAKVSASIGMVIETYKGMTHVGAIKTLKELQETLENEVNS